MYFTTPRATTFARTAAIVAVTGLLAWGYSWAYESLVAPNRPGCTYGIAVFTILIALFTPMQYCTDCNYDGVDYSDPEQPYPDRDSYDVLP